jgi:hypothetical protein
MWATFVIFQKLSKVNNHPMVENSPNLVTLVTELRGKKAWTKLGKKNFFTIFGRSVLFPTHCEKKLWIREDHQIKFTYVLFSAHCEKNG